MGVLPCDTWSRVEEESEKQLDKHITWICKNNSLCLDVI